MKAKRVLICKTQTLNWLIGYLKCKSVKETTFNEVKLSDKSERLPVQIFHETIFNIKQREPLNYWNNPRGWRSYLMYRLAYKTPSTNLLPELTFLLDSFHLI